jgi:hypothetical protein
VSRFDSEMIEKLHEIECEAIVRQCGEGTRLRSAVAADVGAHHAIVASEMRHPSEQPQRAAEAGVQKHDERRFFPRIREIVIEVEEARAVARGPVPFDRHVVFVTLFLAMT